MANLRIISFDVIDSATITFSFTENLDSNINTTNITVISQSTAVPDATVLSVAISDNILTVTTTPLTPFAAYTITLFSTHTNLFRSVNGSVLFEDGKTNAPLITGPINPENNVLNDLRSYYKKTPYDIDNPGLINSYLQTISDSLYKARNSIWQSKTDNYVSITQTDELQTRGAGPYDRLGNEGVYEIIRVGQYPQDALFDGTMTASPFPKEPITLQTKYIINERLIAGNAHTAGTFNGLIGNLRHDNITKITGITIYYASGIPPVYAYNIDGYGYQLKDARYDSKAATFVTLNSNQFKFSEKSIKTGFVAPVVGDILLITYQYKDLGIYVDPDSISVAEIDPQTREVCPPIASVFSLKHANIVNQAGTPVSLGAITFYDPKAIPPYSTTHPAFLFEMPYNAFAMPVAPGYYSVDYANGKVYVFGADATRENVGTGPFPPVCSYYYKKYYKENLDYTYDPTLLEIATNSERELIGANTIIAFKYSENYVPGTDYEPQVHQEELDERIQNRLHGTSTIDVLYAPITNVFRIFNETTGEVYKLSRFTDTKIIFNYNRPPTVLALTGEKTTFEQITDETLLCHDILSNVYSLTIWQVNLNNSKIIATTEDCIGSSINTSILLSNKAVFAREIYYDRFNTLSDNLDKLNSVGKYVIDYDNGIIYVCVVANQISDIGTISYKSKYIQTKHQHILSVDKVYTQVDETSDPYVFQYNTFSDTRVDLTSYDISDKQYLSIHPNIPILVSANSINLPRNAKALRGVYEVNDLNISASPINFAPNSVVVFSVATLVPVNILSLSFVGGGNTVIVPEVFLNSNFGLDAVIYVKRRSDGYELYNTALHNGGFSGYTITLPTDTPAVVGDTVELSVNIKLLDNAAVIVDIDYGGLYIDYTFLFDEIIVNYEHGDNVLDFRKSDTVQAGQQYYVSYKYGALRDSLFANFGSIINIDDFKNFNVDLERERYRDALMACLQNFPKGPTKTAISEIARLISHVKPDIIESMFEGWTLGSSYLYDNPLTAVGCRLLPGVWDNGVYFENQSDCVEAAINDHIKIDNGTAEFWVIPNWNGLDNDATLNIMAVRDGYHLLSSEIFIGVDGYNPGLLPDKSFNLSKFDIPSPEGMPYMMNAPIDGYGLYVWLDAPTNKWNLVVKDGYGKDYWIDVITNGEFYNVQPIGNLDGYDKITTTNTRITIEFFIDYTDMVDGYGFDGLTFMSDKEHYLFDYGETENENRISIFKDGKGYLNLRVFSKKDRFNHAHYYQISHDISDWKAGDSHQIAFSNKVASKNNQDELHLFIDGFEVPNILKYGGRPVAALTDRFRTIVPEIVVGTVPRNTICGNDLSITAGSSIVRSASSDFGLTLAHDHSGIGHILYIEEIGFATSYAILPILPGDDAHELKLAVPMPYSLNSAKFCVNKWTAPTSTELMYESNLYVSRYYYVPGDGYVEQELPGLRATRPAYAVSVDGYGQPSIVIRNIAETGDQIFIRTLGLNHRRVRERVYVWGSSSNIINLNFPPPITLDYTKIFAINKAKYVMNANFRSYGYAGYATETIVGNTITTTGILPDTQPSNEIDGRTLTITTSGDNTDYSTSPIITIYGTTYSGAPSETLTFTKNESKDTTELFLTISSIDVVVVAMNIIKPTMSFEIREKYQITKPENDGYAPIIRYSFQENASTDLDGYLPNIITSNNIAFFQSQIGDTLVLTDPPGVAGSYIITNVVDYHTITVSPNLPIAFSGGSGGLYNVSISRSGFANGLFTFEFPGITPINFDINQGFYDFDYATYLEIPFELRTKNVFIGNDFAQNKNAYAIIDEFRALDYQSVDTRVGEALPSLGRSITTDYLYVLPFEPDKHTTMLLHMNELPPIDSSIPYGRYSDDYFQFDYSLNENFYESLYIHDKPFEIDNKGIVSGTAGTIEFWISPKFDSRNDPTYRYMFDTNSAYVEEITSLTKTTVVLSNPALRVYSVQLQSDTSVSGKNYALGGRLSNDRKTYTLGQALPNQQTPVRVVYIPYGIYGSRFSIYKTPNSTCAFEITTGITVYAVESPIFWTKNSWHRVMATWDFSKPRLGEMHLFIDGEEKVIITAGSLIAGSGFVSGSVSTGTATNLNISIVDQFQTLLIGSNFIGGDIMESRIDNLKISRKKKSPVYIYGQAFDNDYSSNLSVVLPVVEDLYTTYLSDFNRDVFRIRNFALLKNAITGAYDFTLKVIDSFDIIDDDKRIKQILENLITALKPANSRAFISYIK